MPIIAGGTNYKWRGINVRAISIDSSQCITMPMQDSKIIVPIQKLDAATYTVEIHACNKGGNGRIQVFFEGNEAHQFYVKAKQYKIYSFDLIVTKPSSNLIINKPKHSSGNLLIKTISYEKNVLPKNAIESPVESKTDIKKSNRLKVAQVQLIKRKREREARNKDILNKRGEEMSVPTVVGGSSYKWRGKNIRTLFKYNTTCVCLPKSNSLVMTAAQVSPDTRYKVTIFAACDSGNEKMLFNFFGGIKYDGPHTPFNVISNKVKPYEIYVKTPSSPKNLPLYLRAFRQEGARVGNVYIKSIQYVSLGEEKPKYSVTRTPIVKVTSRNTSIRAPKPAPKVNKVAVRANIKGTNIMKFKPYEGTNLRMSEEAKKIMIHYANQVPKVSIITPTRDGADLLKKCYAALDKNTGYPNWEWIVGDSISDDNTEEVMNDIVKKDSRVKFIQRGTNEGSFSSINNELVEKASGEYYLFLNNDTEPQALWLYEMMSKIHRHREIGIVGARLMYGEKRVMHAGIMFGPSGPMNINKPLLKALGGSMFTEQDRFYQAVTAACLLMRKEDFDKVKGFDPVYHFCYEDVDLCLKVRYNLNKKVLYAANAVVQHDESSTQKKHGTGGVKQRAGIDFFKDKWRSKIIIDFPQFTANRSKDIYPREIAFITCVNNSNQYNRYIVGSLFLSSTKKNYEVIPVMNHGNRYSAAQALNLGIDRSKSPTLVLCHQDVAFYKEWINTLFSRIKEINAKDKRWGVLGTAGIDTKDRSVGVVHTAKGKIQWRHNSRYKFHEVQTVDEHCMIIRKASGLRFDQNTFNGFHCYGPDISLNSLSRGLKNYGILNPLVHDSSGSGSLATGKVEFMRYLNALAKKWKHKFNFIRTTTSVIRKNQVKTFINFR